MSAPRPRPVTATIRRPPPSGTYRAKKNVTLLSDSGGSTESLVSCVDGSDLDSYSGSGSERDRRDIRKREERSEGSASPDQEMNSNRNRRNADDDSFSEHIKSEKSSVTTVTKSEVSTASTEDEPVNEVGPWEQWMIKKTESEKKLIQQKSDIARLRKQQQKLQELEKLKQVKNAKRIRQEWLHNKNEERAKQERRQLLRDKRRKREEEIKKRNIEEKADQKYKEWLEQKKKTDALRHSLEIEQQKLKELELKEKKKRSDDAFKTWLEASSQRAKFIPHSYAKCDGALTGYYNSAASPTPAYFNPVPWQPVALPVSHKKPKVKVKGKRRVVRNAWTLDN